MFVTVEVLGGSREVLGLCSIASSSRYGSKPDPRFLITYIAKATLSPSSILFGPYLRPGVQTREAGAPMTAPKP